MTAEQRARDFLRYIGENEQRLRRNLAKNVTYDADIFENAFQDTVVKVYESVLRNNADVGDYESYFFQASRKRYMTLCEKERRRRSREIRMPDGDPIEIEATATGEEAGAESASAIEVERFLKAEFGEPDTGIFLDYMGMKSTGRTSYKKFGMEAGIPSFRVKEAVTRIKHHLREKYRYGLSSERAAEETERIVTERIRKQFEDGLYREEEAGAAEGGGGETQGASGGLPEHAVEEDPDAETDGESSL